MPDVVSKYVFVVGSSSTAVYRKLIARDAKPFIVLDKRKIHMDIWEGFGHLDLHVTAATLQEIQRTFLLRSVRKSDMWQFSCPKKKYLTAIYKTKESAIFVANALAEIDYQTEPYKPYRLA